MPDDLSVAVIGAGFGGIATVVKLARAGFRDVTVFDKAGGPGGTWWHNTYPGCEVDVPTSTYSFSFMPNYDWSCTHAPQAELQRYAEDVIDHFGVRSRFRFGAEVTHVQWDAAARRHRVRLAGGEEQSFDLVVCAVGMLDEPRYPEWPGLETFTGPRFHTARWEHEHDLSGRTVACVGTGSTAAQLVPALAPRVGRLLVFQREPGWIVPKGERDYSPRERRLRRRVPAIVKWERLLEFARSWRYGNNAYRAGSRVNRAEHARSLRFIADTVSDPAVADAVTPRYPFGCKRTVIASNFYPALNHPNVTLVPEAVARVNPRGLVDATGAEHPVDALVMGTGFHPYGSFRHIEVTGEGGRTLEDLWGGDPRAFLGITVAGVPNFFILFGPNTNGGRSIIAQIELQVDVVVRAAKRLRRTGDRMVQTRPLGFRGFIRWVDRRNARMQSAGSSGCHNYFFSAATGRNVTQWPSSHIQYRALTRLLPRFVLVTRR